MQQLGFDIDFYDPTTNEVVPWGVYSEDLASAITKAPWKLVDIETTGLNPASKPLTVSGKEIRRGVNPALRLRILSISYPHLLGIQHISFDMDTLTAKQRAALCASGLNNVVAGHNVGFDAYWMRRESGKKVMPTMLLDTMLIARVMRPDIPIILAKMCTNEELDYFVREAAEDVFKRGRSGFSLADCMLAMFQEIMSKEYQGPANWAEPFLTQNHYNYASGDTSDLLRLLNVLLKLPADSTSSWLDAYMRIREEVPGLKIVEPQVIDVIQMREKGMPWIVNKADVYVNNQRAKVAALVDEICDMQPTLTPFKTALASLESGITENLKRAVGEVFTSLGLELEVSEKKGEFKIGEKDLRRVKAELNADVKPFFSKWVGLMKAKKAAGMAREVSGFATRSGDGRLHPNTGHGPITGRLSSSEPNCFVSDTDIFTPRGWVPFKDLTSLDKVAQVNDEGFISFIYPSQIIAKKWTGLAVRYHSDKLRFDTTITPKHGMYWADPQKDRSFRVEAGITVDRNLYLDQTITQVARPLSQTKRCSEEVAAQVVYRALFPSGIKELNEEAQSYVTDEGWLVSPNGVITEEIKTLLCDTFFMISSSGLLDSAVQPTWMHASRVQEWLIHAGVNVAIVPLEGEEGYVLQWAESVLKVENLTVENVPVEDNTVYCVSVPEGRILVRSGGVAWVSGNCQQFPRDQGFRDCVEAAPGYKIVASDYSALDMRVGAALAIRAQQQIFQTYMGERDIPEDVMHCIVAVVEKQITLEQARAQEKSAILRFEKHMKNKDEIDGNGSKAFWELYRKYNRQMVLARFTRCYAEVRENAETEGTPEWGSLRDAFSIDGMDIHTWTALSMIGKDPKALFMSLPPEEVGPALKKHKKELGDVRQTGKVGNLSLLYAMKTKGLMDAAAKNYNIHWTFDEADKVRKDWLAAYVEIDLWHIWTELNPVDQVYIPDKDKKGAYARKNVFLSETLGGRKIYAFSLNAALSYEDQSTGADILGRVMETFRLAHADVYQGIVNQVHDEIVFELPDEHVEEMTDRINRVMKECSEFYLMQYGVKGECSPAVGQVWLKD